MDIGGKIMKQVIFNNKNPKGVVVEIENVVATELKSYKERVVDRIRAVYSVDDELAILRQKDTKPEEFAEYNTFVEKIKQEERG